MLEREPVTGHTLRIRNSNRHIHLILTLSRHQMQSHRGLIINPNSHFRKMGSQKCRLGGDWAHKSSCKHQEVRETDGAIIVQVKATLKPVFPLFLPKLAGKLQEIAKPDRTIRIEIRCSQHTSVQLASNPGKSQLSS